MIAELAEIRLGLVRTLGAFTSEGEILAAATQHLPVLAEFDVSLSEELLGIAEGSGVSPAKIVVLNHDTDLRDIVPAAPSALDEEDCSAVFARTAAGALLGHRAHADRLQPGLLKGLDELASYADPQRHHGDDGQDAHRHPHGAENGARLVAAQVTERGSGQIGKSHGFTSIRT